MTDTRYFAIDPETGDVVGLDHAGVAETLRDSGWDVGEASA